MWSQSLEPALRALGLKGGAVISTSPRQGKKGKVVGPLTSGEVFVCSEWRPNLSEERANRKEEVALLVYLGILNMVGSVSYSHLRSFWLMAPEGLEPIMVASGMAPGADSWVITPQPHKGSRESKLELSKPTPSDLLPASPNSTTNQGTSVQIPGPLGNVSYSHCHT